MQIVADLHLHSPFSRAVSKHMTLPTIAEISAKKGIDVVSAPDWTHHLWFDVLKNELQAAGEGLYTLKNSPAGQNNQVKFLLSTEIACIYSQGGKLRRVHLLVLAPTLEIAEKIGVELVRHGCTLTADGRPIVGLSAKEVLALILTIDARCLMIPAHIWTPHFGVYGSASGYASLQECFEDLTPYIYGVETGLSSDPQMNWQVPDLKDVSILSFSDAHSPAKIGRELTVFELSEVSYASITSAIKEPRERKTNKVATSQIAYTIEFYPEEGKYHYTGHRVCHISLTPDAMRQNGVVCPTCGRKLTEGVLSRVVALAQTNASAVLEKKNGVQWFFSPEGKRPPYVKLVPLLEIVAEVVSTQVGSKKAHQLYSLLLSQLGSEISILLNVPLQEIEQVGGRRLAEAMKKVRMGEIVITPGFDGEYGIVSIWGTKEKKADTKLGFDL